MAEEPLVANTEEDITNVPPVLGLQDEDDINTIVKVCHGAWSTEQGHHHTASVAALIYRTLFDTKYVSCGIEELHELVKDCDVCNSQLHAAPENDTPEVDIPPLLIWLPISILHKLLVQQFVDVTKDKYLQQEMKRYLELESDTDDAQGRNGEIVKFINDQILEERLFNRTRQFKASIQEAYQLIHVGYEPTGDVLDVVSEGKFYEVVKHVVVDSINQGDPLVWKVSEEGVNLKEELLQGHARQVRTPTPGRSVPGDEELEGGAGMPPSDSPSHTLSLPLRRRVVTPNSIRRTPTPRRCLKFSAPEQGGNSPSSVSLDSSLLEELEKGKHERLQQKAKLYARRYRQDMRKFYNMLEGQSDEEAGSPKTSGSDAESLDTVYQEDHQVRSAGSQGDSGGSDIESNLESQPEVIGRDEVPQMLIDATESLAIATSEKENSEKAQEKDSEITLESQNFTAPSASNREDIQIMLDTPLEPTTCSIKEEQDATNVGKCEPALGRDPSIGPLPSQGCSESVETSPNDTQPPETPAERSTPDRVSFLDGQPKGKTSKNDNVSDIVSVALQPAADVLENQDTTDEAASASTSESDEVNHDVYTEFDSTEAILDSPCSDDKDPAVDYLALVYLAKWCMITMIASKQMTLRDEELHNRINQVIVRGTADTEENDNEEQPTLQTAIDVSPSVPKEDLKTHFLCALNFPVQDSMTYIAVLVVKMECMEIAVLRGRILSGDEQLWCDDPESLEQVRCYMEAMHESNTEFGQHSKSRVLLPESNSSLAVFPLKYPETIDVHILPDCFTHYFLGHVICVLQQMARTDLGFMYQYVEEGQDYVWAEVVTETFNECLVYSDYAGN